VSEHEAFVIEGTLHAIDGRGFVRLRGRYATSIEDLWSALIEPERLARWYGSVEGDLRVGGEFTATVSSSGWDGQGRVDVCLPPSRLEVTMWEEEDMEHVVSAELLADGDDTVLTFERRGVPIDLLWAYGAGWHEHLEDLAAHVAGDERAGESIRADTRFDELALMYQEMTVVSIED